MSSWPVKALDVPEKAPAESASVGEHELDGCEWSVGILGQYWWRKGASIVDTLVLALRANWSTPSGAGFGYTALGAVPTLVGALGEHHAVSQSAGTGNGT
jgi:hypothetical protein